ncbi:hypothetical protein NC652_004996 [Populus alba x Populus x berolinensis]|nr:hypothetical protein NC652_004996 [Populus alba x Populus x berolinensis]
MTNVLCIQELFNLGGCGLLSWLQHLSAASTPSLKWRLLLSSNDQGSQDGGGGPHVRRFEQI